MVHRRINLRLAGASALIVAAFITVGALRFQYAAAQVDATSSEAATTTSEPAVPGLDAATTTTETPIYETTTTDSTQTSASTSELVEVQLLCSQSYTGPLYDTSSGHVEYTASIDENASTTSTVANVIGEQSWTICHDARGHVHEFPITADDYAALSVRGTPQESIMEAAEQAALDSFAVETTSAPAADTLAPAVLGVSTSENPASPDTSSTSTTSAPSPSADTDSSSASTTADLSTATTAPATTSEDSTMPPVTNDSAPDTSQAPATATTTDTPSI